MSIRLSIAAIVFSIPASPALPDPITFSGRAQIVDGDTIDVGGERIRLTSEAGPIDAPELGRAKCPLELFRAQAARERLRVLMAPNDFTVERRGRDKYGRTVAVIYSEGVDVASTLVREGHAKMWIRLRAKDRPTWCEGSGR